MAPSTHILTDTTTVATTAFTAASIAKSLTGAGHLQDLHGNANLCLLKITEVKTLLNQLVNGTDAADPNLTTINNLLGALI